MNKDIFMQVFEDVVTKIECNLKVLWPSSDTTAPTESNLVTALSLALDSRGYTVFTEVPFNNDDGNGRIDLIAIHQELGEMVLFEAKSDKPSDGKLVNEMINDWERLRSFTLTKLPDNKAWVNEGVVLKKHICVGFWSEIESKIDNDEMFKGISVTPTAYKKWIANGVNIGVKFFFKSI